MLWTFLTSKFEMSRLCRASHAENMANMFSTCEVSNLERSNLLRFLHMQNMRDMSCTCYVSNSGLSDVRPDISNMFLMFFTWEVSKPCVSMYLRAQRSANRNAESSGRTTTPSDRIHSRIADWNCVSHQFNVVDICSCVCSDMNQSDTCASTSIYLRFMISLIAFFVCCITRTHFFTLFFSEGIEESLHHQHSWSIKEISWKTE